MEFSKKQSFKNLLMLILAGEMIFILPFVLARIFRPTFLEVFALTNKQLGFCFSIYGLVALVSYFFGGLLADRFRPGPLMGIALILTALGGIPMATFPSFFWMKIIFGYWGVTTILLFWAVMIKSTRSWGGDRNQGIAFGFLDAGRGLVSASFGMAGLFIFSFFATQDVSSTNEKISQEAFRYVILTSTGIVALIGVILFGAFKEGQRHTSTSFVFAREELLQSFTSKNVWLLMVIVLCGYVGFKTTDVFSQYAHDVMHYDQVDSAKIGTFLLYLRPFTGLFFGILSYRIRASFWIIIGFLLMLLGALILSLGTIDQGMHLPFILLIVSTGIGVYTVRALYFAIIQEGRIPIATTGTVVGMISLVGFTPDIFMGPVIGHFLDEHPGKEGFQYVFFLLFCFAFVGSAATIFFRRWNP